MITRQLESVLLDNIFTIVSQTTHMQEMDEFFLIGFGVRFTIPSLPLIGRGRVP